MRYILMGVFFLFFGSRIEGQILKASLQGSHESMVRQNEMANEEDLSRLRSAKAIKHFESVGALISLDSNGVFAIDKYLPKWRRFARPWAIDFLNEANDSLKVKFGKSLIVTSCIRDAKTQRKLRRILGNQAASVKGELPSTHLTGAACDVSRRNLSYAEESYFKKLLLPYESLCYIEATEHGPRNKKHFHIFVSKRFENKERCLPQFQIPFFEVRMPNIAIPNSYALIH